MNAQWGRARECAVGALHRLLQRSVARNTDSADLSTTPPTRRTTFQADTLSTQTMESTSDARISLTILLGCESRSFMMLSITDISVAVVSCERARQHVDRS